MSVNTDFVARSTVALKPPEGALDWLIWIGNDGSVIDASTDLCRDLGYDLSEITDLIAAPIDIACSRRSWQKLRCSLEASPFESFAAQLRCANGSVIPVSVIACYVSHESTQDNCVLLRLSRTAVTNVIDTSTEDVSSIQSKAVELEAAFESLACGVLIWDRVGRCEKINAEGTRILGFTRETAPATVHDIIQSLDPINELGQRLSKDDLIVAKVIQEQRLVKQVVNVKNASGDRIWINAYGAPIKNAAGEILGVSISFIDITVSRRQDSQLRRSASLLDRVEEIARVGYWEFDLKTGAFWGSPVALEIYGLSGGSLGLKEVRRAALPEYHEMMRRTMRKLIDNGGDYDIEFKIRRQSDGAICDLRSRAVYRRDEGTVTGVLQDVTAHKVAEANLRTLSSAVQQSPASIIITDPGGVIEYVNPKFTEVTGYVIEETIGLNPSFLKSENTVAATYKEMWAILLQGHVWRGTLCNKKKNGEHYWELASISPIFDSKGKLTNYISVNEDITERINADMELAALNDRAVSRLGYLQAAHNLELELRNANDLPELRQKVITEFARAFTMDGIALWSRDEESGEYSRSNVYWSPTCPPERESSLVRRSQLIKATADAGKPTYVVGADCLDLGLSSGVNGYGILPLHAHGELLWLMEFRTQREGIPSDEWWDYLETIGAVCALALHNAKLIEQLKNAHGSLVEAYDATLEGWSRALDLRDRETEGHSQRVSTFAVKLARQIGMSDDDIVQVRRGALLHDVGKLGVPDRVLMKPGKLSDEEWEVMRLHPVYAYEWLSRIRFLAPALSIPHYHHERWDGTGYPERLAGKKIPIEARLFTIIDVWDALTNDRPYRLAWTREKARQYMLDEGGAIFDPELAQMFVEMLDSGKLD